jgi:nitrite reductase/ring-hydroxylating ferredoxin subunit
MKFIPYIYKHSAFLLLLAFLIPATGCKKDDTGIPLVAVDVQLNVNNPSYFNISVPGGWVYINGGSKGIIVYRKSVDEFMAYDRHSPYQSENGCVVVVDSTTNVTVIDECSDSHFLLTDGSVFNGPAGLPLKQYQTSFSGSILRIYN